MENIANLLFEAKMLKEIPRSGFHFLGAGKESVAEHSFSITFIAYVMAQLEPEIDPLKLITMCLVHDLPEAKIGDLNTVQKEYVTADEDKAVKETVRNLPFGPSIAGLIEEFNDGRTPEAKLARDADHLALILDLKALSDIGYSPPKKWLPPVLSRMQTKTGKMLAASVMKTEWDSWWIKKFIDTPDGGK